MNKPTDDGDSRQPHRGWRFSIKTLLAVMALWSVVLFLLRPLDWEGSLKSAVADSRRVVIETREYGDPIGPLDGRVTQQIEIHSQRVVQQILAAIEIDENAERGDLAYPGRTFLRFQSESGEEQVLALLGAEYVRWRDGNWPCDATLTASSAQELARVISELGIRLPDDLR